MVKSVKDAVKEVVEGKVQNIEIHTETYDIQSRPVRKIVTHEDIAGYSMNGDWVAVMMKDATTYIYPAHTVQFVKHYTV